MERKTILASAFVFLKDEAYDRLKVKEYFKFLIGLYESNMSIEEVVQYVGLLDKLNVKIEKTIIFRETSSSYWASYDS